MIMKYIENLGLPATVVIAFSAVFLIMQTVGEFLEFKGKVVPEIMKIRKYFARKKAERKMLADVNETLAEVKKTLEEAKQELQLVNTHYSSDNITMRNNWMHDVDDKQERDHAWIETLDKKLDKIDSTLLEIRIEDIRSEIIGFAGYVADGKSPVTRQQFNRIFRIYGDYEQILEKNKMTNGETDTAMQIIRESYEENLRKHSFVENVRGFETPVHGDF